MNDNMDGDVFVVLFRGIDRPELANGSRSRENGVRNRTSE